MDYEKMWYELKKIVLNRNESYITGVGVLKEMSELEINCVLEEEDDK